MLFLDHALNNFDQTRPLEQQPQKIHDFFASPEIKSTPYMKMENFLLTPDSDTTESTDQEMIALDSENSETTDFSDQEMSFLEEKPEIDMWMTPKLSATQEVHILQCRRINFDIAEDEEMAKGGKE